MGHCYFPGSGSGCGVSPRGVCPHCISLGVVVLFVATPSTYLSHHSLKGPHSHAVTVSQMVVSLCLGRADLGLCTCPASPHILPGGSGGSTSEVACRPEHCGEWGADPLVPAVYWRGFYQNEVLHLPIHLFICFSVRGSLLACLGAISSHHYHTVPGLSLQAGS